MSAATTLLTMETLRLGGCSIFVKRNVCFSSFSWVKVCLLYENCVDLDASDCDDCVSGAVNCTQLPCFTQGLR